MKKDAANTFNCWRSRLAAVVMAAVLLSTASVSGLAGTRRGFTLHRDQVNAYATDVYTVLFLRGEPARVAVKGDGDTDLDLYVYDENGNLVAKDDDGSDACGVYWVPSWTGSYTIRIVNRGRVYNEYTLATN